LGKPETRIPPWSTDDSRMHLMTRAGASQFRHQNAAYGDELNSTTPSAAGGVTICTGADNYKFNHNWICGNLSTGDGGGFAHLRLSSANGSISNNQILFNQSSTRDDSDPWRWRHHHR